MARYHPTVEGVGAVAMVALGRAAEARGGKRGLPVATQGGRALYQALGWPARRLHQRGHPACGRMTARALSASTSRPGMAKRKAR